MAAYKMNSCEVSFESMHEIEDASMVSMFNTLETTGLRAFLSISIIIYEDTLLDLYVNATVNAVKQISRTLGGKTIIIDEASFPSNFSLPNQGL